MLKSSVTLVGATLVVAVALGIVVQRSRAQRCVKESKASTPVVQCVLQRDEVVEVNAAKGLQNFPVGCSVTTKTHGVGEVTEYNTTTNTYTVKFGKGSSVMSLTSEELELVVIRDLIIYPIKSCGGIRLTNARLTARGIANDRLWMFTDSQGTFITQRRYPTMALIETALDDVVNPSVLTLRAPNMPELAVPIIPSDKSNDKPVRVWKSNLLAIDQGDEVAKWINTYLEDVREEHEFRLMRLLDCSKRMTESKYAPGYETGFTDAFPYLLAVDASIKEVNSVLKEPIAMDRFRPNIVLSGAPAFADESWNCICINGIRFRNVKPCDRCNVPCVDQTTGIRHEDFEPKTTLTPLRSGEKLGFVEGSKHTYYFGTNMIAEELGEICIGASVKVLTMKQTVYA